MEKIQTFLKSIFIRSFGLYEKKKYNEALELITGTQELWFDYKQKERFITLLGMIYIKTERLDMAERVLLEALTISPGNIKILDLIGGIYFTQARYKESERIYLYAKREDYFNFDFTLKCARAALKMKRYDKMIRRLKQGYYADFIGKDEEKKLKKFLIDFLNSSECLESYDIVKEFRKWCMEKKNIKNNRKINKRK